MHGEITEPLDWFASDDSIDDLTVPDWLAPVYDLTDWRWVGDATTQPALSMDSAALSGPLLPSLADGERHGRRRAMLIYLCSTVVLTSLLFAMFFVLGGRFSQSAPPRAHHAPVVVAALPVTNQLAKLQPLAPQPHSPSQHVHGGAVPVPQTTPPPSTATTTSTSTGDDTSLWSSTPTPAPATTPAPIPTAVSPPPPPSFAGETSSLWAPNS